MSKNKKNQNKRTVKEFSTVATSFNSAVVRLKRYLYSSIKNKDEIKRWLSVLMKKVPSDTKAKYSIYVKHTSYTIISMALITYKPINVLNIPKPSENEEILKIQKAIESYQKAIKELQKLLKELENK